MSSRRSLSRLFEEPGLRVYCDKIRNHTKYIDHKFRIKRGRDIKPEKVEELLNDLEAMEIQLEKWENVEDALSFIEAILFQCEAALIFYYDKDDPARYLETLKKRILPSLKVF